MKKLFLSFLLLLAVSGWLVMWADSATPYPIKMRQPDGSTITLRLHGDEFCSWYTSEDGRTIYKSGADGWWREDSGGGPSRAMRSAAREQRNARDSGGIGARKSKIGWGEKHFLVILVQWSDRAFQSGFGDYFTRALNEPGFSDFGSVGSARDYYRDASQFQFQPVFDLVGPVTIARNHNEWPAGDNDSEHYEMARTMIREAVAKLDSEIDFSAYDVDKDGYVDGIYMVYPGYSQSEGGGSDTIWPHKSSVTSSVTFDGVKIGTYGCSAELRGNLGKEKCGIGTFCHEFGHVLGLPDLYDTDYEINGRAFHPSNWNLMAGGEHNSNGRIPPRMSLMERYMLGYITVEHDLNASGQVTLRNLDTPAFYRIPTANEGEFFLPEVRDGSGFDSTLPAGMLIYHVDRSQNMIDGVTAAQRWENGKLINGNKYHPCHYLEIPDKTLLPYGSYAMDGEYKNSFYSLWVFPSNSDWNVSYSVKDYDLKAWDGSEPYSLHDIKYANGEASFTMIRGNRTVTGVVTDSQTGAPVQGAVVLLEAKKTYAPSRVYPMLLSVARSSASYEAKTDYNGQFLIELPDDFSQQLLLSVFATNYQPAHADLSGWSVRKEIQLDPVISGGIDVGLTKAIIPFSSYLSWGYTFSTDYTVAVHYTAVELKEYEGGTISTISFSTKASGEEVWVFVDYGTKERVFARRVTGINTTVYFDRLSNQVDISDANVMIPAGTDLYVGYIIKQSNASYAVVTDKNDVNPQNGSFMFYHGFSTTSTPGARNWQDMNSSTYNGGALIAFTAKAPIHLTPGTSLTDLGISYIDLPSDTLSSGQELPLKLVSSPVAKPFDVKWFYDDMPVEGESLVLTAGTHILMARLKYADGREDKVESQVVVQ